MANQTELYNTLKRNPDNQFFLNLMDLLEFRLSVIKDQLIRGTDDIEFRRLQGRGQELQEMITALTRKPVKEQAYTGSFS